MKSRVVVGVERLIFAVVTLNALLFAGMAVKDAFFSSGSPMGYNLLAALFFLVVGPAFGYRLARVPGWVLSGFFPSKPPQA